MMQSEWGGGAFRQGRIGILGRQDRSRRRGPRAGRMAQASAVIALALGVAGCSSMLNPQTANLNEGLSTALITDARARTLINSNVGTFSRPGLVDPVQITCAEPPPDVATAVASSLNAGISLLGRGSAAFSAEEAMGLAQIAERTASIQLLQHRMFHTCLAYKNGAISGTAYTLAMSRLDDTMVTLLAAENAVGRFGAGMATIGTGAAGEAEARLMMMADRLAEAAADTNVLTGNTEPEDGETGDEGGDPDSEQDGGAAAQNERLREIVAELGTMVEGMAVAFAGISGGRQPASPSSPELAAEVGRIQSNFLEYDYTQRAMDACLVELALAPANGLELFSMGNGDNPSESFNLMASDDDSRGSDEAILNLLTGGTMGGDAARTATPGGGMPSATLSGQIQRAFSEEIAEDPDYWLAHIVSAHNMTRRSALGTLCGANMPQLLEAQATRHNIYRLERLQNERFASQVRGIESVGAMVERCDGLDGESQAVCLRAAEAAMRTLTAAPAVRVPEASAESGGG